MIGSSRSDTSRNQPIRQPSVTPMTAAIMKPPKTRYELFSVCWSQVPEYGVEPGWPNIHSCIDRSTVRGDGTNRASSHPCVEARYQNTSTSKGPTTRRTRRRALAKIRAPSHALLGTGTGRTVTSCLLTAQLVLRLARCLHQGRIVELFVDGRRGIHLRDFGFIDHLQQRLGFFRIKLVIQRATRDRFLYYCG